MASRRRFLCRRQNWLALFLVSLFFVTAAAAPLLSPPSDPEHPAPYKEIRSTFYQLPSPPEPGSPLGLVPKPPISGPGIPLGQGPSYKWDVFHTLVWGTRSALRFGLVVTLLTATLGTLVGVVSAYAGGAINGLLMRFTDTFLVFPPIAAVWVLQRIVFSRLVDPYGLPLDLAPWQELLLSGQIDAIMVSLILFSWMPYARIINGVVLQLKQEPFIEATRAMGAGHWRIIWRHLLPNALAPAIVLAARDVGGVVILATAFTFIGLGGNLAWGVLLVGGRDYIIGLNGNPFAYWWVFLPISLALILFSTGWNLLGDGLNDWLNPYVAD